MAADPTKAALFRYVFVAADDGATGVRDYLREQWERCASLGMSDPVDAALPTELPHPVHLPEGPFRVLAARRSPSTDAVLEAYAFADHDVFGIVACIAPNAASPALADWAVLAESWDKAGPDRPAPAGVIGEATLFTALAVSSGKTLDERVRAALPGENAAVARCRPGVTAWAVDGRNGRRVLAVVGPPEQEREIDGLVWWRGTAEPAPFLRGLLHAAKLDYEAGVYRSGIAAVRRRQRRVDESLEQLIALHRGVDAGPRVTTDALVSAQGELSRSQADSAGLLVSMTRMRELRRTVLIAQQNLRAALPEPAVAALFRDSLTAADWTTTQIDHDIEYGEAARERVDEVRRLTSLQLQQAQEHTTRLQSRVTLIQTTVLGGLGAMLGASRAFNVDLDPGPPLRMPLLIAFVALLVALPPLLVHWYDNYGWFDYLAAAVLGAATGVVVLRLARHTAPPAAAVAAALAGAAVLVALARLAERSRAHHFG